MDTQKVIELALQDGFTLAAPLDPATIQLREEVREMCAENKCHAYNKNWACPPACGTVEACSKEIRKYTKGVIVQTTGQLEDDFDFEAMEETAKKHGEHFMTLLGQLREETDEPFLPLGAGGCSTCKTCTYPDAPCRFPEKMVHPMEGYGILINDVCTKNHVPYNHGRGTLTYVGCFLFN